MHAPCGATSSTYCNDDNSYPSFVARRVGVNGYIIVHYDSRGLGCQLHCGLRNTVSYCHFLVIKTLWLTPKASGCSRGRRKQVNVDSCLVPAQLFIFTHTKHCLFMCMFVRLIRRLSAASVGKLVVRFAG